mmetsp:Transcript_24389/g.75293  ORF Transcript_24389/g.75293 Transcript_24389/m.75293 type:complete len:334 (-) Transcript_24389:314-1315(-)
MLARDGSSRESVLPPVSGLPGRRRARRRRRDLRGSGPQDQGPQVPADGAIPILQNDDQQSLAHQSTRTGLRQEEEEVRRCRRRQRRRRRLGGRRRVRRRRRRALAPSQPREPFVEEAAGDRHHWSRLRHLRGCSEVHLLGGRPGRDSGGPHRRRLQARVRVHLETARAPLSRHHGKFRHAGQRPLSFQPLRSPPPAHGAIKKKVRRGRPGQRQGDRELRQFQRPLHPSLPRQSPRRPALLPAPRQAPAHRQRRRARPRQRQPGHRPEPRRRRQQQPGWWRRRLTSSTSRWPALPCLLAFFLGGLFVSVGRSGGRRRLLLSLLLLSFSRVGRTD